MLLVGGNGNGLGLVNYRMVFAAGSISGDSSWLLIAGQVAIQFFLPGGLDPLTWRRVAQFCWVM